MRTRAWRERDLPEMIAIWNEVVEAGEAFPQEESLDSETGRLFFSSQSHCGVAEDDGGAIIGLYILHPNNVGRCGHICNASYAVAKGHRGKGAGALLVRDSLARGAELGFKIMQFNAVVLENTAARKLYASLGFQPLGIVEGGFRRKDGRMLDIQLFWRRLDPA